jgi:hypothetical protein
MMVVRARRCRSRARMRQAPNFRRRSRRHHQRRHGVEAGKQRRAATMMTIKDDMPTVTLDDIHRRHDGARAAQHGRQCRDLRGVERRAPRSYPIGRPRPAPIAGCAGVCEAGFVSRRINAIMPGVTDIVSAVIPCLDEEDAIGAVVAAVPAQGVAEVIVVDGASRDRTVECATAAGARVVVEPRRGLRGRDKGAETAPEIQSTACRDKMRARNPRQFGAIRNEPGNLR